ncbi:hypothetical protein [Nonomuraea rhodomycinica]|uniref:DUF3558 domain-containing protein n=1 Tax=Nonomuraea rhodomycinica TaxID=1712872 RepID=A0A7Y6IKV9_9ACTN|nr:hypothetical protein [Nonomuraea rhodomycinica]NUW40016.1 hypothetical protein [Nonomuraea rhodomycinica]
MPSSVGLDLPTGGAPTPARPKARRPWVTPVVAAGVALLLAGGAGGAYLVYGRTSAGEEPAAKTSKPANGPVPGPDVCAMLPKETIDRLVPEAKVTGDSRSTDYTINFDCTWANPRISFGEYWRSRQIEVRVDQHRGDGAKTGRSMAQNSFEIDRGGAKYAETAKPTAKKGDKDYTSKVTDLQGVGDGAFAQYVWRRSGSVLWYSYGEAHARVGDMTIEVKYQADQRRKDAAVLTNKTVQSITEDNAIREVTGLVGQIAKGVAAWKAAHPDVLAQPLKISTPSPSLPTATPSPSPTPLAAMPADCVAAGKAATALVPDAETKATGSTTGAETQNECRWLNRKIDAGGGVTKVRSVLITTHRFVNRAGAPDPGAASTFYASRRGGNKSMESFSTKEVAWDELTDIKGMGDAAYSQYLTYRRGVVFAGSTTVMIRKGALVVAVDYAGQQHRDDEPTNSPKVRLMAKKEARAGALKVARAYLAGLEGKPTGS